MNGYALAALALIGVSAGLAVYELACSWCGAKRFSSSGSAVMSGGAYSESRRASSMEASITSAFLRAAQAVSAFSPMTHDETGSLRERLRRAGVGIEPETWRALVAVAMVGCAGVVFFACVLCKAPEIWVVLLVLGAAAMGRFATDRVLTSRERQRRSDIEASLPDAMELLAVALAAGSPVEQCFKEVSASLRGPLSDELRLVDQEVNLLGRSRNEALEHLAQRCASQEVSAFVGQITQAIDQGSSVSEGLAAQALLAREQAQAAALERIRKMPTKLDIVLSACFLPPTVIMVLVPTVVKLLTFLNGGMV